MYGRATLAIEVSSTSMNVASVTVSATTQWLTGGLTLGCPPPGPARSSSLMARSPSGWGSPTFGVGSTRFRTADRPGRRRRRGAGGSSSGWSRLPASGPSSGSLNLTYGTTERPMNSGVSCGLGSTSSIRTGSRWVTLM